MSKKSKSHETPASALPTVKDAPLRCFGLARTRLFPSLHHFLPNLLALSVIPPTVHYLPALSPSRIAPAFPPDFPLVRSVPVPAVAAFAVTLVVHAQFPTPLPLHSAEYRPSVVPHGFPGQTETCESRADLSRTVPLNSHHPTMNALRSSSAFARRSLTPASISAPLSSSRLLSSSSSQLPSSQRSLSSVSLRSNRLSASRWSGSTPSVNFFQIRTMASESKIKVVNPVVELDGDEVRNTIGGSRGKQEAKEEEDKKKDKTSAPPRHPDPSLFIA